MNKNNVSSHELYHLGCQVWSSLGSLQLTAAPMRPDLRYGLQRYVGVTLGEVGYFLLVGVDSEVAINLAIAMFDCPRTSLCEADIQDALGEAANMLAGKIAELIGSTDGLGLPRHLPIPLAPADLRYTKVITESGALSEGLPVYLAISKETKHFSLGLNRALFSSR